jgi:hypothetical protein
LSEDSRPTLDYSADAPTPAWGRTALKWGLRLLIVYSLYLVINSDVNRLFVLKKPDRIAEPYALWDNWITGATAPGKGLFLTFDHFPPGGAGYAQNIYFRAVYVMYPLPLLVTGPGTNIKNGDELLQKNNYPGDDWLLSQGVDSVMTIRIDPKRKLPVVSDVRWLGK